MGIPKGKEHLAVGNKDCKCEFCYQENRSPYNETDTELVSDVEGCEIYAHRKCFERAKMLVENFDD